jgi:hypothetical protein
VSHREVLPRSQPLPALAMTTGTTRDMTHDMILAMILDVIPDWISGMTHVTIHASILETHGMKLAWILGTTPGMTCDERHVSHQRYPE